MLTWCSGVPAYKSKFDPLDCTSGMENIEELESLPKKEEVENGTTGTEPGLILCLFLDPNPVPPMTSSPPSYHRQR